MFGRNHDGDPLDGAVGEQFSGDAQGKRSLTCARSGDRKEIARLGAKKPHQCPTLPASQSLGVGRCNARTQDSSLIEEQPSATDLEDAPPGLNVAAVAARRVAIR